MAATEVRLARNVARVKLPHPYWGFRSESEKKVEAQCV